MKTDPVITEPLRMLMTFACLLVVPFVNSADAEQRSPNVLFLAVDDMKDWVNCLGGYEGTVHTPNIDRLAGQGVLFRNAHCPSPKCAPSRAAIMTGLRPSTTGLYDNGHWWLPNLPDAVTMPQHFRNCGYRVVGAGKIFHHTAGNNPPNQWDDFFRLTFRNDPWFRSVRTNYPWSKFETNPDGFPFSGVPGLGHENDWGALAIPDEQYDDALSAEYAVSFLKSQGDAADAVPFFLACGLFRPHLPWYVPQKFFDMYSLDDIVLPEVPEDDLDDVPDGGLAFAKARRSDLNVIRKANASKQAVRAYLASISYADKQLGRVLDALHQSPQAINTIIVLWSDHGWHLGEKLHWHKSTLWEEATRVPLIISSLRYRPGVCDRPVSLLDLYPTLRELCTSGLHSATQDGAAPAGNLRREQGQLDGVSLVPLLMDPNREWNRPAVMEYKRGNVAVRSDRYRYIRYRDGGEELYDHSTDPHEWNNIATLPGQKGVKDELARWGTKHWAESAATKKAFHFDPDTYTWTHSKTGTTTYGKDK